jgi:hypothetical protein
VDFRVSGTDAGGNAIDVLIPASTQLCLFLLAQYLLDLADFPNFAYSSISASYASPNGAPMRLSFKSIPALCIFVLLFLSDDEADLSVDISVK